MQTFGVAKTQIEAQRSGFDLERRSDAVNERRLLKKSRRERYEVRDDAVGAPGFEPGE